MLAFASSLAAGLGASEAASQTPAVTVSRACCESWWDINAGNASTANHSGGSSILFCGVLALQGGGGVMGNATHGLPPFLPFPHASLVLLPNDLWFYFSTCLLGPQSCSVEFFDLKLQFSYVSGRWGLATSRVSRVSPLTCSLSSGLSSHTRSSPNQPTIATKCWLVVGLVGTFNLDGSPGEVEEGSPQGYEV